MRKLFTLVAFVLSALASLIGVAACSQPATASDPNKTRNRVPVQLHGYNHTNQSIYTFSVDGAWGGSVLANGDSGFTSGGRGLPRVWVPGIKVSVEWTPKPDSDELRTDIVDVPAYNGKAISTLNVHFLRDGTVKVFATHTSILHPDYPFTGPESYLKEGRPNKQW
jgi:hypothetical protein